MAFLCIWCTVTVIDQIRLSEKISREEKVTKGFPYRP